jgi:phospholipid transport system substrate-binding protein
MRTRLLAAVVAALSAIGVAAAAEPTAALKQRVDRVLELLAQPGERRAEIRRVAEDIFDFEEMSRRALGPHWNARTLEERRQFVPLFTDVLERAYIGRVESGRGGSVTYLGESIDGDDATVRTKIITAQRTEIPVDYRMRRKDGRWRVFDVSIEGVSLVNNYRSQFNSVIQSSSYNGLVDRLRSLKESGAAASPTPPRRSQRDQGGPESRPPPWADMSGRHPDVMPATRGR